MISNFHSITALPTPSKSSIPLHFPLFFDQFPPNPFGLSSMINGFVGDQQVLALLASLVDGTQKQQKTEGILARIVIGLRQIGTNLEEEEEGRRRRRTEKDEEGDEWKEEEEEGRRRTEKDEEGDEWKEEEGRRRRRTENEDEEEGRRRRRTEKDEEGDEWKEEGWMLWQRVRMLAKFASSSDGRLLRWLHEMALTMISSRLSDKQSSLSKVISSIADRLQWVALQLALRSLPPICSPSVPRRPDHPDLATIPSDPIPFNSKSEATARVDLAGGWTDTPPITYQCVTPPAVLNVSIKVNGKRPLRCQCFRLQCFQGIYYTEGNAWQCSTTPTTMHFPTADSVFANHNRPSRPGSLLCAILIVAGIVREDLMGAERVRRFAFGGPGRGLYIRTDSDLPHGSGLGTSSILSGALLAALWRLCGKRVGHAELVHAVLRTEQLHGTGGGWQDQIGGCVPGGFKLGSVAPRGLRRCLWHSVPLAPSLRPQISLRLLLVYTGRTRLAKHLLQQVLISWLGGEQRIRRAVEGLAEGARRAEEMLMEGHFPVSICREYNELKKEFTPSTEPPLVGELIRELVSTEGLAEVAWMAGAGGGGFLYVWLAKGRSGQELEQYLAGNQKWRGMSVWRAEVEEQEPMSVE